MVPNNDKVAGLLTNGLDDCFSFRWETVRYEVAQGVRTMLCEEISPKTGLQLSPSYVNCHLAALRSVLKEAWRLGLMSEEQRARACDLKPVRGSTLPAGRSLSVGEKTTLARSWCPSTRAGRSSCPTRVRSRVPKGRLPRPWLSGA